VRPRGGVRVGVEVGVRRGRGAAVRVLVRERWWRVF
jgi:hypothetical protein